MILYLVWLSLVLSTHEAFKILVVFPRPSKSHSNLGDGLVRHLLNDGHEVTYISPFPFKSGSPNLRVIDVSSNIEVVPMTILKFETVMNKEVDVGNQALFISAMINMADFTIQNDNVQKLLNNPMERFDLVIAEWVFTDLLSGLAAVFDCPYIWISNLDIHWMLLRLIDQPTNPAYTSDIISYNLPPFTFWQRITELYTQIEGQIFRYMYFNDMERRIYENSLAPIVLKRGRQPPSYYDIQYNASLVFANSHVSLGQAVSIPQNCIPIGGFHIEEYVKPLPEDIKKIMDDAQHGVIYFSMGSNLRSKDIPKVMKDSFLRLFGELKQTVLWKFEEDLPNKPKNVHILNWAPQQSILAHPNTVIFITHGGLLSITETIHFGVPIIGIPAFADQFVNVARAVNKGFACKVQLSYEMADKLKEAIEEVITNSNYAKKARELSFIYHNRPVTPGREILFWVRHVIETRGALHLRSPALNVPLYQTLYLDLLVIILIVLYLIIKLINHIRNATCTIKNLDSKKKL